MNNAVSRTGMTIERWNYLKKLAPSKGTYKHVSAEVSMIPNPLDSVLPPIPMVTRPGTTYNVGRNKTKRENRSMKRR